jgi:uncharacterized protein
MKPTHFDLSVNNVTDARRFFEAALGWQFERFPFPDVRPEAVALPPPPPEGVRKLGSGPSFPYEYYRITAGAEGEPGIDGGIAAVADAPLAAGRPMTQVTVEVPDLDAVIARVTAAGGRVVEPRAPIPGIGWYATCAEPGGLMFGLIQSDPAAGF